MFALRHPAVAGMFYPADAQILQKELKRLCTFAKVSLFKAKGIVVPHAGYVYSGQIAAAVYSQIEIPDRIILLSPNHTGRGVPFSIMSHGAWRLPLGDVQIDEDLANQCKEAFPDLEEDTEAHQKEHALEVQLPFLQYLKKDFQFVPMTLSHLMLQDCLEMGHALAKVVMQNDSPVLLIASSDLNHYEDQQTTLDKDNLAIQEMLKINPEKLYQVVHEEDISMCGIIPTTVMLEAVNLLNARKTTLVEHRTSGDVSGDYEAVVGYAGIIIE